MKTKIALLLVVVFLPALALRLVPVTSESFQHDAVVSQLAAGEGIVANAWDTGNAYHNRRYHPPLQSYLIIANNALFGSDPYRARFYSVLAGALACLITALCVLRLAGAPFAAVIAGWLVATLPVHLYISRTANWDAVYAFFSMAALTALAVHMRKPRRRTLCLAAACAALAFLTCELGLSLLPSFAIALWLDARRRPGIARDWIVASVVFVALIALLWPAGVFKLDALRTLRFRYADSTSLERNAPWHRFYRTLFEQAPAYTIAMVIGLAGLVVGARRRTARDDTAGDDVPFAGAAIAPLVAYVTVVVVLSLRQRLVYIHHIADLFAPLTALGTIGAIVLVRDLSSAGRRVAAILGVATVLLSAPVILENDPTVVGPQEHPGLLGISAFLADNPGRVYYYHTVLMSYYAPEVAVTGGDARRWTAADFESVREGGYDYVVTDRSMFDPAYPNVDAIAERLAPGYALRLTVPHRRTGEPVAWIFGRRQE